MVSVKAREELRVCGHSQPEPPGLQVLLLLLHQPVALEVAAATQALHDLQEADLTETEGPSVLQGGGNVPGGQCTLQGCPGAPPGAT